jgi:phosphate transport system permease protein
VAQTTTHIGSSPTGTPRGWRRSRVGDVVFKGISVLMAVGLIALLILLLYELTTGGARAFGRFGINFLTGRNWNPVLGREQFGALPFVFGTLVTSAIAIVLAVPVAVGLALLLNEVNTGWIRDPLAVFVDLLAAIPSVVYGLWALFIMKPVFDHRVEPFLTATIGKVPIIGILFRGARYCLQADPGTGACRRFGFNSNGGDLFTAGVILAIMILPIVTAVTREVIAVVPRELREGALALGATRFETVRMAILPYARSGIVGATMLGLGRALGETIAVSMVVGNGLGISGSLFQAGYTIPAVIASEFREATNVGVHRSALLALALVLVMIALFLAAVSRLLVRRTAKLVAGPGPVSVPESSALRVGR